MPRGRGGRGQPRREERALRRYVRQTVAYTALAVGLFVATIALEFAHGEYVLFNTSVDMAKSAALIVGFYATAGACAGVVGFGVERSARKVRELRERMGAHEARRAMGGHSLGRERGGRGHARGHTPRAGMYVGEHGRPGAPDASQVMRSAHAARVRSASHGLQRQDRWTRGQGGRR